MAKLERACIGIIEIPIQQNNAKFQKWSNNGLIKRNLDRAFRGQSPGFSRDCPSFARQIKF